MLREKKEQVVERLTERLTAATTLIVADYRGLSMQELDKVRAELLGHGATFAVCKNTLTRRAAQAAGIDALDEYLIGPTAIAFVSDGDMVAVAKVLSDTARTTKRLALKGALLDGRPIGAAGVADLATLPPADVLRGQVLAAIIAPLTSLVGLVNAPLQNLVGLLDARADQLRALGDDSAPAPQAEAPPVEAAAPAEAALDVEMAPGGDAAAEDRDAIPTGDGDAHDDPADAGEEPAAADDPEGEG